MVKKRKQRARNLNNAKKCKSADLLQLAAQAIDNCDLERANDLYKSVLKKEPSNLYALQGAALIALEWGVTNVAENHLKKALSIDTTNIPVLRTLAMLYVNQHQHDNAINCYVKITQLLPEDKMVDGELARLYVMKGDLEKAREHYKRAFALNPQDPRNLYGLAQLDHDNVTSDMTGQVEQLLNRPDVSLQDRCSFYFALGSIHDKSKRYDEAFANYTVANLAKGMQYDVKQHSDYVDALMQAYSSELFEKHNNHDCIKTDTPDYIRPVFIIGMPRSGTTLVEQILSAHDEVYSCGELDRIERIAAAVPVLVESHETYPECVGKLTAASVQHVANSHRQYLRQEADADADVRCVTDKMPTNFLHLGLIALLFPDAHVIHCQRDPLDTCLSCYFQNFSGNHPYAYDLQNLASYYRDYQRLMAHWHNVLPLRIHTVHYEQLVTDNENMSRQLVTNCGLEWQTQCLEFYRSDRNINTASVVQVRQPVYQASIERWRHYDKHINLLKQGLEMGVVDNLSIASTSYRIQHQA